MGGAAAQGQQQQAPAVGQQGAPAQDHAAAQLGVSDRGAVKYIQSVSQNLVTAGLTLSILGCTLAFREGSGFGTPAQYWFVGCAVCFFLMSLNTAGIANGIEGRLRWLEISFVLVLLQLAYIIFYASFLMCLVHKPAHVADSCSQIWAIPPVAIASLIIVWSLTFGRPQVFAPVVNWLGRTTHAHVWTLSSAEHHQD